MKYVRLFFQCFLGAYALVQCFWVINHWLDLVDNGLRTGNLLEDLSQLINWWLFWAINYAVFDALVSLLLGSVLFGIILIARLLKHYGSGRSHVEGNTYVHAGPDGAVAFRRSGYAGDNGVFYLLRDHLGSSGVIVDGSGNVAKREFYYPLHNSLEQESVPGLAGIGE